MLEFVTASEAGGEASWPTVRIAMLRNYAAEGMLPLLKFSCFKQGLRPDISLGDYDNIRQEILDQSSHVYREQLDLIVISLFLEHLDPQCKSFQWDPSVAEAAVVSMLEDLVAKTSTPIVVNTLLPPLHAENGLGFGRGTQVRVAGVNRINGAIRACARQHSGQVHVVDSERIARRIGEDKVFDYRFMYMYRAPFKKEFGELYCAEVAKIARLLKGLTKKCIVLDCDNTLWGGVVGEEGIEGIALGPHDYPGRCFFDFQQSVLNLIGQGIIVALCSKNNEDDVFEVLDKHPHSLLKKSHLAAWRINWNNKADNIRELAQELNLGLDSFVFVDDNPVECQLIKDSIPEVTVLQVPAKAYNLPDLLYLDGYFDALTVSSEDAQRTQMYVAERERNALKAQTTNMDEYLASLQIRARIHRATESELSRVAQLFGKTNQFNLTTRRHPESRVREMAHDPSWAVYVLDAGDRFSELGLVGVLVACRDGETATVDSLLMSCRALGRRLETAFVDHCLTQLEARWGVQEWRAAYLPTKKNGQVSKFWEQMGFAALETGPEGTTYGVSSAARPRSQISFIHIDGE